MSFVSFKPYLFSGLLPAANVINFLKEHKQNQRLGTFAVIDAKILVTRKVTVVFENLLSIA